MRALDTIPPEPPPEIAFHRRVSLLGSVVDLVRSYEMVTTLTERELRIRYKQAILGVAWALLQPITLVLTFTFFIGRTIPSDDLGMHNVPYALFNVVGLIPWTFFASAVGVGGLSLLQNLQLVNKISCPREVFPLAMVGVAVVDTIVSMVAVIALFASKQTAPHLLGVVWAVPLILLELMFTAGVTLTVSALIVHVRDIRQVLPVVLQMGIVATPVIWSFSKLTRVWQIGYSVVNPLGPVIDAWRSTILLGRAPDLTTLALATVTSLLWLLGGFRIFKRLEASFADLL